MKKKYFIIFSIMLPVFFLFLECSDDITNPDIRKLTPLEKQIISGSDEFGFNLFKNITSTSTEKNIFISPFSISMALGMTLNGAADSTYEAIQSTLELSSLTNEQINENYKSLIDLLTQIDPKVQFDIANSIWYKKQMNFEQKFIDVNKKYFYAQVEGLDFNNPNSVNTINNWVNENTNSKIQKILTEIPSDAVMFLINAIYFKGTWKFEFKKENTYETTFNSPNGKVNCKMMQQRNKFKYYENEEYQAVDLPYGSGQFSMTIILPKENVNINKVINELNKNSWQHLLDNLSKKKGSLFLPRFKIESEYLLNYNLKALGMEIAFSAHADFTKLYKPGRIYINEVRHKTFLKVDEEGTEAAAVTSVGIYDTSVGGDKGFVMMVNRPFILAIKEKSSGSLLFLGKIITTE